MRNSGIPVHRTLKCVKKIMRHNELVSLQRYLQELDAVSLPRHEVEMREIEGRIGRLAVQGE